MFKFSEIPEELPKIINEPGEGIMYKVEKKIRQNIPTIFGSFEKFENPETEKELNKIVEGMPVSIFTKNYLMNFNKHFLREPLNINITNKYIKLIENVKDENFGKLNLLEYIDKINKIYIKNVLLTPEEYNHFKKLVEEIESGEKTHKNVHADMVLNRPKITNHRIKMLNFSKYYDYSFRHFPSHTEAGNTLIYSINYLSLKGLHNIYYNLKLVSYLLGIPLLIGFSFTAGGLISGFIIKTINEK